MTDRKLVLAVAQMGGVNRSDSRALVVRRLVALLKEGKAKGASFVVFPELAFTTFFPRYWFDDESQLNEYFETAMPNDEVLPLFACARELGVGFYIGYAELTPQRQRFNSSILVDEAGKIIGKYRKIHLPGHTEHKPNAQAQHLEKKYFEVGDEGFRVWDALGTRIGMCICNDRRWPEAYRVMALQSAELVVLGYNTPSSMAGWLTQPHQTMFHHLLSLQAGAYQNSVWVAAAAKSGSEDGHHMIGGSAIVAPSGELVAQAATEDDEVIAATIDLNLGENYRQQVFNFAEHRRPEHYGLLIERVGRGEPLPVSDGVG